MVYCVKCGVQHSDDAKFCVNCGATLVSPQETTWGQRIEEWAEDFGKIAEEWGERFGKQMETECFRIPHVAVIFGFIVGIIIILAGLLLFFGWNIEVLLRSLGSLATIIIGVLIIVFSIRLLRRRKS